MYSPKIVENSVRKISDASGIRLKRYTTDACIELADHIDSAYSKETKQYTRDLSREELDFIRNEQLMCSVDFLYWAKRYARIKTKRPGKPERYCPWDSQLMLHELMVGLEDTCEARRDGIMICNLKARQLGMSTVYEMVLSHKAFFTHGFNGLLAADDPNQSEFLFGMMERIYDNLPEFLRPLRTFHVKGAQMVFRSMDSMIIVQHGNLRADIGRGKTVHGVHLSELEKWENTEQIDSGLMPALPRLPTTMAFFESTGEYRGSWWHAFCNDSMDEANRFTMFFVPWYAEPNTYSKPAPSGWKPDELSKAHARQVERDSPKWMRGRTCQLSRDQLFFWEFTRNEYAKNGKTGMFFCEYASSPQEAFRSANSSVFTYETIEFLRSKSSNPKAYEVRGKGIDHESIRMEQIKTIKSRKRKV